MNRWTQLTLTRRVEGLSIDGFRVHWDDVSDVWHDGIRLEGVNGADMRGVILRNPRPTEPEAGVAAIRCHASTDVALTACRALPGTDTFIDVSDSAVTLTDSNVLDSAANAARGL